MLEIYLYFLNSQKFNQENEKYILVYFLSSIYYI